MACEKKGYTTYREAQETINLSKHPRGPYGTNNRIFRKKDKKLERSYKCPECNLYHITSKQEQPWLKKKK